MRLLVVSQYFWPEDFRINELVAELVGRGHEVTVLTGRPNYPTGQVHSSYRANPAAYMSYANARVVRMPLRPRGSGKLSLALNYLSFVFWGCTLGPWKLRREHIDAIFMFEISPITAALPAVLLRRLKRAPLSIWVLDLWPDTLAAVGVLRSRRALDHVGRLVSFIYKRCDQILVQSRAFFGNVAHWAGSTANVKYFPAWAEAVFEGSLDSIAIAPEVAAASGGFNVMFAGNIGEAQDFPAILEAARILSHRSDIRWLIVGDGRVAREVRDTVDRMGLSGQVVLLGRHSPEKMPSFFRGADALLVSLRNEPIFELTIPGKVQSYLATGVPIVGMLGGEGARILRESGAGLVCDSGDSQGLARLVERLAEMSAAERAEMGTRGRAYCKEEFDRTVLVTKLEAWLAETVKKGPDFYGS